MILRSPVNGQTVELEAGDDRIGALVAAGFEVLEPRAPAPATLPNSKKSSPKK